MRLLYLAHFLLELVLGGVKLKGSYSPLDLASCSDGTAEAAAKFCRHHGVSLLAIAALGGIVLARRLTNTATGEVVSLVLSLFHAGAVAVMVHASHWPVAATHAPFAIAFAWHAMAAPVGDKKR